MQVSEYQPKKRPVQQRSKMTFNAIVDATARLLKEGGYRELTTNRIAEVAGVSIGTLYEFFPNKESIVAILAERLLEQAVEEATESFQRAVLMNDYDLINYWVTRMVEVLSGDQDLYRVLIWEIPFLYRLPAIQAGMARLFRVAYTASDRMQSRVNLPSRAEDTWLITRMVASAGLEIVVSGSRHFSREQLTAELVLLTYRMIYAKDPEKAH